MNYKFPKSEKLKSKRHIEQLYKNGKTKYSPPLSVKYLKFEGSEKNLCGVSVPKRKFKKAVDRNLIKRQMREAYRLNKHLIVKDSIHFHMMFVYSTSENLAYQDIEKAVKELLKAMS